MVQNVVLISRGIWRSMLCACSLSCPAWHDLIACDWLFIWFAESCIRHGLIINCVSFSVFDSYSPLVKKRHHTLENFVEIGQYLIQIRPRVWCLNFLTHDVFCYRLSDYINNYIYQTFIFWVGKIHESDEPSRIVATCCPNKKAHFVFTHNLAKL